MEKLRTSVLHHSVTSPSMHAELSGLKNPPRNAGAPVNSFILLTLSPKLAGKAGRSTPLNEPRVLPRARHTRANRNAHTCTALESTCTAFSAGCGGRGSCLHQTVSFSMQTTITCPVPLQVLIVGML